MRILEEVVESYLRDLRPERSEVMREMEELAERDSIPIVHWETGRLLAVLCRVLAPVVLEVGTAIGYSTLHMADQLERGRVVTLERDPERAAQARSLMSGEVALPEDAETWWNPDSLASARRLNSELAGSERWLACVLPVGDGIGVAARRKP
jgi:predicted O-methyltransferase YrrM